MFFYRKNGNFLDKFFLIVILIWIIGQSAIFLKTQFEHRRDRFAVGNIKVQEKSSMNTQRWNPVVCTTNRTSITIMIVFVCHIHAFNILLKWSNLNPHEKSLLATNVFQMILCLAVPLYMFAKNKSMFHHLIHEILEELIENLPTNLPSLSIQLITHEKKRSQILMSKSAPKVLSSTCTLTDTNTIKQTNEMIPSQVQEETFDKIKEKPNQDDYQKGLPYQDHKALFSAARLKNAGFQLSNKTPEDGNCLIHALKDQMR